MLEYEIGDAIAIDVAGNITQATDDIVAQFTGDTVGRGGASAEAGNGDKDLSAIIPTMQD